MEFNEQFYNRLIKLLQSTKKEAACAELRKIINDVTAYYVANNITELWQNLPGDDVVRPDNTSDIITSRLHGQIKGASSLMKKDQLLPSVESNQNLLKASPSRANASSPNVAAVGISEKRNSKEFVMESLVSESSLRAEAIRFVTNVNDDDEEDVIDIAKPEVIDKPFLSSVQQQGVKRSLSSDSPSATSGNKFEFSESPTAKQRKFDEESKPKEKPASVVSKGDSTSTSFSSQPSIDELGLFCVVCRKFSIPSGNKMLECHECHNLYHQKCHEPNIPQSQMDDPRLLWFCNSCNKKIKKSTNVNTKPTIPSSSSSKSIVVSKEISKEKIKPIETFSQNRLDGKDKSIQTISQTLLQQKPVASLAADFLAKHKNKSIAPPVKTSPVSATLPSSFMSSNFSTSTISTTGLVGLGKLAAAPPPQKLGSPTAPIAAKLHQFAAAAAALANKPAISGLHSLSSANVTLQPSSLKASSSTSKLPASSANSLTATQAAEKRLQQMKKKAASRNSFGK